MSKRFTILLIIILVLALGTVVATYYLSRDIDSIDFSPLSNRESSKEDIEKIKERYPDILTGTISFSNNKITVKTESGEEYLLWLPRPQSFYESRNIQDGQEVEIRGKILDGQRIYLKTIK